MTVFFSDSFDGFGDQPTFVSLRTGKKQNGSVASAILEASHGESVIRQEITVPADGKWHSVKITMMRLPDGTLYVGKPGIDPFTQEAASDEVALNLRMKRPQA